MPDPNQSRDAKENNELLALLRQANLLPYKSMFQVTEMRRSNVSFKEVDDFIADTLHGSSRRMILDARETTQRKSLRERLTIAIERLLTKDSIPAKDMNEAVTDIAKLIIQFQPNMLLLEKVTEAGNRKAEILRNIASLAAEALQSKQSQGDLAKALEEILELASQ